MLLKERSAGLLVDLKCVKSGNALDSILEHLFSAVFDGSHE